MPRLSAARYELLLDFVLESAEVESERPFPESTIEALRRVVPCDVISYREWDDSRGYVEGSVAGDNIDERHEVWARYPLFRRDDPLPTGPAEATGDPPALPSLDRVGVPLLMSDVIEEQRFRRTGLYHEVCRPLGVRSVLKLFLPSEGSLGSGFVLDTSRASFDESDRYVLRMLVPHLVRLRRHARARSGGARLKELTPRERSVLGLVAAGETNEQIAAALFVGPSTVAKHLEHIYEKLGVHNRTAAAACYLGRGQPRTRDADSRHSFS